MGDTFLATIVTIPVMNDAFTSGNGIILTDGDASFCSS
jgi:hypothetical protein